LDAARQNQLEGIVAKRLDSPYEPGRRSPNWLKIKIVGRQEFVVGGWTPEVGDDRRIGALLLGYYDCHGKLVYAGKVGSGLGQIEQTRLMPQLKRLGRSDSPFSDEVRSRLAHA